MRPTYSQLALQEERTVYMDANATTPLAIEVFEAMLPWMLAQWGNPSSSHAYGREARLAVETARSQIAALLHSKPSEIVFTSGGTESDNLAIFGTPLGEDVHVITSSVEHHAVLHAVERLERNRCAVTYLPVDGQGLINPDDLRQAIQPNTRLISIMMANNETGVLQPVEEIGHLAREYGIRFHTDAVQAAGKIDVDVTQIRCDLLSVSSHKMHGPQGVGALYIREGIEVGPLFSGGSHERGYRAGTENVMGVVGFGCAAEVACTELKERVGERAGQLRDDLESKVLLAAEDAGVNGGGAPRVPNTTNIWFGGLEGAALLTKLDELGLAVSGGSACTAGSCEPSHVLLAMGLPRDQANASIRFSLNKRNTEDDVTFATECVAEALRQMRVNRKLLSGLRK